MPYYSNVDPTFPTLVEALQSETVEELKKLAALVKQGGKMPARKADLVKLIESQLAGEEHLKALWRKLDQLQQAAVAETVHGADARFHANRFVAKYGANADWGAYDRYYYNRSPSLLGLLFYKGVMPEDLRQRFRQFVPEPPPTTLDGRDELPEHWERTLRVWDNRTRSRNVRVEHVPLRQRATDQAACHDLKAVLRLIEAGKLAVSDKTAQAGITAIRQIESLLLEGDFYSEQDSADHLDRIGPIKPFAWPLLVQAGSLAKLDGKRLVLTRNGLKALSAPPEDTLGQLWQRWLKTTLLDELRRIDRIKGQTGRGKRGLTAVASRRQAIHAALCECPAGAWVAVNDLFAYMIATDLNFDITRNPEHLYVEDPNYGNLAYQGYHDWHILQARYALCLLFEYAATLGLIDVAYIAPHRARYDYDEIWGTDDWDFFSRYDGLLYIRLNPLGAYCLGRADRYAPAGRPARTTLRVLPNLEIAVTGGSLEPAAELLLNGYAVQRSDAVWKLDRNRILQALEAGQHLSALRELLESSSDQPLPETVEQFLRDLEARAGQLRPRGHALLIDCADAALAAQIANDARTRPYCLLAGERSLAVPADGETRFRSALRKLGYILPR